MEKKIDLLFDMLKTDGEDLTQLAGIIKSDYHNEEDVTALLEDIIKVKDDIAKVVAKLKKEL